ETEVTPEIPRGGSSLSIPTGAAAARMALDQPGVGVSSAHANFIPCVTSSDDDEPRAPAFVREPVGRRSLGRAVEGDVGSAGRNFSLQNLADNSRITLVAEQTLDGVYGLVQRSRSARVQLDPDLCGLTGYHLHVADFGAELRVLDAHPVLAL